MSNAEVPCSAWKNGILHRAATPFLGLGALGACKKMLLSQRQPVVTQWSLEPALLRVPRRPSSTLLPKVWRTGQTPLREAGLMGLSLLCFKCRSSASSKQARPVEGMHKGMHYTVLVVRLGFFLQAYGLARVRAHATAVSTTADTLPDVAPEAILCRAALL